MAIRYCPYFCEENIWHLATDEHVIGKDRPIPASDRRVVFISNARRWVAMRNQRAGGPRTILWDYHVVLLAQGQVWDLESTLGFPIDLDRWIHGSFCPRYPDFAPRFRVIDAPTYRNSFASDRSHMLGPGGLPRRPFPPWPRIGVGMNLPKFIDLETPYVGQVVDLDRLGRTEHLR
ncbi:MAG TPA: hypothetical protein VG457_12625 [Planctomycetota bacterium]|jgi:hypothetical protein|nr:hypothetical protein [Planctomycetota bacterium]